MKRLSLLLPLVFASSPLLAQEEGTPYGTENLLDDVNILWTCLAAFLVFFMQAGFAMVEIGLTRAKNACNILMKNLMDLSVGSILFWMVGFGLMFGISNGWIGTSGFFFDPKNVATVAEDGSSQTFLQLTGKSEAFSWAFLLFQTVFCATAATIVSGAVAGRTKYTAYLVYSCLICAVVYPVFGAWAWGGLYAGGGWLEAADVKFYDFAGSTVVHSIGGWCALAGAIVVGPRLGKYRDGRVHPIPGHSIPFAALGVFILWLGWFGFNAGSTTEVNAGKFAIIAVNTNLAAAAGAIGAMFASWTLFKKPDTSFALNGALAGLVTITAGCDALEPLTSVVAGLIGGVIVVGSVLFFDKIKVDDPVGAISVHGVCGAWGTLAVALFSDASTIGVQLLGIAAAFLWAFPVSLVIFLAIKFTIGMRVSEEDELRGLDLSEHGMESYPGFAMEVGRDAGSAGTIHGDKIAETVGARG